jgi:hypothetical protein
MTDTQTSQAPHPRAAHYRAAFGAFEAAVTSAVDDLLSAIDAGFAGPDRGAEMNGIRLALGGLDAAPGPAEEEATNLAAAGGVKALLGRVRESVSRLDDLPTRIARGLRAAAKAGERDADAPALIAADFGRVAVLENPAVFEPQRVSRLCGLWDTLPETHWARTVFTQADTAPHPDGPVLVLASESAHPAGPFDLPRVRTLTKTWRESLAPWQAERAAAEARARQEALEQAERERMESDPREQIKLLKARLAALEAAA